LADRTSHRVRILLVGASISAVFAVGLGLAPDAILATIALVGMSIGQAFIFPTHNSLLADFYPVAARSRIYYTHRGGTAIGAILGVLVGAGLTNLFDWRAPFFFFAALIGVAVAVGSALREPARGHQERVALARAEGSEAVDEVELEQLTLRDQREHPPSLGEAWRTIWKVRALRRTFAALPLLSAALVGFASLASLQYQETFHLGVTERAFLTVPVQVFHIGGLVIGAVIATRRARKGISKIFPMLGWGALAASGFVVLFALAPNVPVAFVGNAGIELSLAIVAPGVLAALSLAIPARARTIGFSITALFILPGVAILPVVGAFGDTYGFRYGLLLMVPVFAFGGSVIASAGSLIDADVHNVWVSMQTRAEMLAERERGQLPLLAVRHLSVGYGGNPVLKDLNLTIAEGEIVALLGTNGAGKSTLLRAIGGVVEADHGAVVFDGRDITHTPPDEIARLGIGHVCGGDGVFPSLSVEENLRAALWAQHRRHGDHDQALRHVLALFPVLSERSDARAGDLSGGQQQMLAVAMAFITQPRLLLIDELSLGLSPLVVEQLLDSLRQVRAVGTAVLLVEQSVDVAVSVAERGCILDGGEIQFAGTSGEIAGRPDLVRSIYLRDTASHLPDPTATLPLGTTTTLAVCEISKSFGGIAALSAVDLELRAGETLGVIGPNGAGKTTLFDVISGFEPPDAGRIMLHGIDVTDRAAPVRARLGLGRSFQDSRLFSSVTVREVLAISLERFIDVTDPLNAMLRFPALQDTEAAVMQRVDELLALFGIDRFTDMLVGELSTGSRRLVDLAAVVAHQPDVVLLDEPASGVAQHEVEHMAEILDRVRAHLDAAMIIVEHNIPFIAGTSDRLLVLDRGTVLTVGVPDVVLSDPAVIEAFLGSRGANGAEVPPAVTR
jgi:branched-chain amino acid transport system ATP-binding protein